MTWDRAQKVLIALSLVAGGIGGTLLYQTMVRPPAIPVKQVRTVAVVPQPPAPKPEPKGKTKPASKQQ